MTKEERKAEMHKKLKEIGTDEIRPGIGGFYRTYQSERKSLEQISVILQVIAENIIDLNSN